MSKVSIRFFDDKEVRAIWDDRQAKWWFSVLDIIGVLRGMDDYRLTTSTWLFVWGVV